MSDKAKLSIDEFYDIIAEEYLSDKCKSKTTLKKYKMEVATYSTTNKRETWYNIYKFPLIPQLDIKKANEHNSAGFTFRWLFFTIWTLDSFQFELTLVCSSHWGLCVIGLLPYLRWCVCLPIPESVSMWVSKYTYRGPKY